MTDLDAILALTTRRIPVLIEMIPPVPPIGEKDRKDHPVQEEHPPPPQFKYYLAVHQLLQVLPALICACSWNALIAAIFAPEHLQRKVSIALCHTPNRFFIAGPLVGVLVFSL